MFEGREAETHGRGVQRHFPVALGAHDDFALRAGPSGTRTGAASSLDERDVWK